MYYSCPFRTLSMFSTDSAIDLQIPAGRRLYTSSQYFARPELDVALLIGLCAISHPTSEVDIGKVEGLSGARKRTKTPTTSSL
jgi:hypothetical protein